jgi:hypothetical protein
MNTQNPQKKKQKLNPLLTFETFFDQLKQSQQYLKIFPIVIYYKFFSLIDPEKAIESHEALA